MKKALYFFAAAALTVLASCGGGTADKNANDSTAVDSAQAGTQYDPEQGFLERKSANIDEFVEKVQNVKWKSDKAKYLTPEEIEMACDYLVEIYPEAIKVKSKGNVPEWQAYEEANPKLKALDGILNYTSQVQGLSDEQREKVKKTKELRQQYWSAG